MNTKPLQEKDFLHIKDKIAKYKKELKMLEQNEAYAESCKDINHKTLYIHAGVPKTGSSALQVFLAKNRNILLDKSIEYSIMGNFQKQAQSEIASGNGALLVKALIGKSNINDFYNWIKASNSVQIVVSSERLARTLIEADNSLLNDIKNYLKKELGVNVKIIYYMRNQVDQLMAGYIQQVKRHGCTSFPDTYIKNVYHKIPHLHYHKFYNKLTDIFEPENVIPRIYEETNLYPGGIVGDFLSTLSIDVTKFPIKLNYQKIRLM
jgi:uncharacterized pyridoxal phosphate-containing UPF0001 family protein